ncbi:MAG: hypothetical protein WA709_30320 [Stellaceae bacterium]
MLTTLNSSDIIEWRLATPDLDLIKEAEQERDWRSRAVVQGPLPA